MTLKAKPPIKQEILLLSFSTFHRIYCAIVNTFKMWLTKSKSYMTFLPSI